VKWHLETWRKLYVTKSPSWLRLSVSARGLGRELLTYCDDQGRIDIGDDEPGVAIAYMLGARPKEHRRIAEDVAELIKDGYLTVVQGCLTIRNFVEAQDRTPGARRTAEWRAKKSRPVSGDSGGGGQEPTDGNPREKAPSDASHVTSHEPLPVTSRSPAQVTSPVHEPVTTFRSDPIRSDPIREEISSGSVEPQIPLETPRARAGADAPRNPGKSVGPELPPNRRPVPVPESGSPAAQVLAELRAHRTLWEVADVELAEMLAGRAAISSTNIDALRRAIANCAADLAPGMKPEHVRRKLRGYCDKARDIEQQWAKRRLPQVQSADVWGGDGLGGYVPTEIDVEAS